MNYRVSCYEITGRACPSFDRNGWRFRRFEEEPDHNQEIRKNEAKTLRRTFALLFDSSAVPAGRDWQSDGPVA